MTEADDVRFVVKSRTAAPASRTTPQTPTAGPELLQAGHIQRPEKLAAVV